MAMYNVYHGMPPATKGRIVAPLLGAGHPNYNLISATGNPVHQFTLHQIFYRSTPPVTGNSRYRNTMRESDGSSSGHTPLLTTLRVEQYRNAFRDAQQRHTRAKIASVGNRKSPSNAVALRRIHVPAVEHTQRHILKDTATFTASAAPVIDHYPLTFGSRLGCGGYSVVFQGTWKNAKVAIKRFNSGVNACEIAKEVAIWKALSHAHVVRFYASSVAENERALVIAELAENGNAEMYLERCPQASRILMIYQVAQGIEYLHSVNIIHGDLKPSNILVSAAGNALISDFGLSRVKQQTLTMSGLASPPPSDRKRLAGTPHYLAPECWHGNIYRASDVYAYAMTCLAIFTGRAPWGICDTSTIRNFVLNGQRPTLARSNEDTTGGETLVSGMTNGTWNLITNCWAQSPKTRPTFTQVVRRLRSGPEVRSDGRESVGEHY